VSVTTLFSAGGSPGVTASAVGLALHWPREVLVVEADPTGASGILPGYLRGMPPPETMTVTDLAVQARAGRLGQTLLAMAVPLGPGGARLIPAIRDSQQAVTVGAYWEAFLEEFRRLGKAGVDVVIDAGRLGLANFPRVLAMLADVALLATRCDLPAIATAGTAVPWLKQIDEQQPAAAGLLLIGPGHDYSAGEIGGQFGVPVLAELPLDPAAAAIYSRGAPAPRRAARDRLTGALRSQAPALARLAARTEAGR